jgi:AraC-like DNA-binding protein
VTETVRAAALSGYFPAAAQFGVQPTPLLRAVGLTPAMLANPEALLPARAVMQLLENTAAAAGCVTFALHMAARRTLADMGLVSLLIAHQRTLRDALEVLTLYRNRINSTLLLQIEEHDRIAILREDFALQVDRGSRQASDLALGVLAQTCATVLGALWQPEAVLLAYEAPPAEQRPIYRQVFQCAAEFGADLNGIVIAAADLDAENPRADAALAVHARALLETVMDTAAHTLVQDVEAAILMLMPIGRASARGVADALGLNLRTLQRQLDAEGARFSELLAGVRRQQLPRHFANPRLRLTDIADLLGYGSLGAFTRWHIDQFGETPTVRRKRLSGAAR